MILARRQRRPAALLLSAVAVFGLLAAPLLHSALHAREAEAQGREGADPVPSARSQPAPAARLEDLDPLAAAALPRAPAPPHPGATAAELEPIYGPLAALELEPEAQALTDPAHTHVEGLAEAAPGGHSHSASRDSHSAPRDSPGAPGHSHGAGPHGQGTLEHLALALHTAPPPPALPRLAPPAVLAALDTAPLRAQPRTRTPLQSQAPPA